MMLTASQVALDQKENIRSLSPIKAIAWTTIIMSKLFDSIPHKTILSLWFDRLKTKSFKEAYFARDPSFDAECRKYEPYIQALIHDQKGLNDIASSDSRDTVLASILLLDQYSRNIWRGTQAKDVYSKCDPLGQKLSNHYIAQNWHKRDDWVSLAFVLLPFEHSEDRTLHLRGLSIWTDFMSTVPQDDKDQISMTDLYFNIQLEHFKLIQKFGRYPHRVEATGKVLTPEESKHLAENGSQFG